MLHRQTRKWPRHKPSCIYMASKCIQAGTAHTVANLICGFRQARHMASCGSLHLVDHASERPGHSGGPLSGLGASSARGFPPASQEPSQAHTWQSMVSSHAARQYAWPASSACRLALLLCGPHAICVDLQTLHIRCSLHSIHSLSAVCKCE